MTYGLGGLRASLRVIVIGLFLLAPWLAYRSFYANEERGKSIAGTGPASPTKAQVEPAQANAKLAQLIEQAIDQSHFANARWGVHVVSTANGQLLYSRNGDKLFTPASNMKLYTTAVALDLLGSDYRWRTSVYADAQPDAAGTMKGNLILYGRGAPDLASLSRNDNTNSLSELAGSLFQRGLRRVTGNVIGDDSYFRGNALGDGWLWNDLQWYFGAEASALSINDNQIDVSITPPAKSGEPPEVRSSDTTGLVQIVPSIASVKRGERFKLGIQRGLSDNEVRVWGEFPAGSKGYGAQLAVHNPALWSARLFIDILKKQGIAVDGQAESRNSRVTQSERFDPTRNTELAFVVSRPLLDVARATNKKSINLNAELILRTLGREREAMLADSTPGRERGDDEAGTSLIGLWLARQGIPTQGLAVHDGSGLSRLDLVTPQTTTGLLLAMLRTSSGQLFRETLPLSGKDGTLQGRLGKLESRVSAKTGSLTYDNSLSGYVLTDGGETLAFSIMCNDQTSTGSSVRVIDQIVEILAQYPTFQASKTQNSRDSR